MIQRRPKKNINPSKTYRDGGFWSGWNQLVAKDHENYTDNALKFEHQIRSRFEISQASFQRWRNRGYNFKNKAIGYGVKHAIESVFAEFGITENIWDSKN